MMLTPNQALRVWLTDGRSHQVHSTLRVERLVKLCVWRCWRRMHFICMQG